MNILENINELGNKLSNNEELKKLQENFLQSTVGQIVNSAVDIGLKTILPDFIENEVIEVKDSLITGGLKEAVDKAIENSIELGKKALGISEKNFENITQAADSLKQGELIKSVSSGLDFVLNKLEDSNIISNNISFLIKNGKDLILDNVDNNINTEFTNEIKALEKIEKYIKNWEICYFKKDLEGLTKEFNRIEKQMKKILPLENILNNVKRIENINELIKNNENFNFDDMYLNLAGQLK